MRALLVLTFLGSAQPSAAELQHMLDRLVETTRVLYVAAHPDDENTQLLAHLVGARHVQATYLSLTRGAGGQNRIGDEQGPMLGLLRTEELLAARRIDGAEQRFSLARDFGYSKSAEETLRVWGHDEVLGDVVEVVRRLRPHVIVTRFPEEGSSHGHHLASARLAHEAFDAASDPARFSEQVEAGLEPWEPPRLVWDESPRLDVPDDGSPKIAEDIGGYDPLRGMSYAELAAESRSQHRSQAFGSAPRHGPRPEKLRLVAGDEPATDLLEGIASEWDEVAGGLAVRRALERARQAFEPSAPDEALGPLLDAYRALTEMDPGPLRGSKEPELLRAIAGCAGLRLAAHTELDRVEPGGEAKVTLEAQSRRPASLSLVRAELGGRSVEVGEALSEQVWTAEHTLEVPDDAPISAPAWMAEQATPGRYGASDRSLAMLPRRPPPHVATFVLRHGGGGTELRLQVPVEHARTDPVRGEVTTPLLTTPPATVTPRTEVQVAPEGAEREVVLTVRGARAGVKGQVRLEAPEGWRVTPSEHTVGLSDDALERELRFTVSPEEGAKAGIVTPAFEAGGRSWSWSERSLDYPHIPPRTALSRARLKLVPLAIDPPGGRFGYVPGAGDTVAAHLAQLGVDVVELPADAIDADALESLRGVIVGVRAWSTQPALATKMGMLMDWVKQGGTLVLQYDKAPRGETRPLPLDPLELAIGRDRVTDETAEVRLLDSDHPALSSPYEIGAEDFEGWVQERGLYFAESWGGGMKPLLAMADPGDEPNKGALVVGEHGEGHVVYTGLALFRQLPAGVPGAYRLVTNLLSLGEAGAVKGASEQGPPFGQWKHWYWAVAGVLLAVIGLLYWLTKRFS